jgi:hypothetical protein
MKLRSRLNRAVKNLSRTLLWDAEKFAAKAVCIKSEIPHLYAVVVAASKCNHISGILK